MTDRTPATAAHEIEDDRLVDAVGGNAEHNATNAQQQGNAMDGLDPLHTWGR